MATAALTMMSLVGGLAVACTAGVGVRPAKDVAAANPQAPVVSTAPAPAPAVPTPETTTADDPAADNPRLLFPTDAVVDVKSSYRAKGDGSADDTAALQKAITENPGRTLYLPAGTYLVSKALEARDQQGRWQSGLRLVGEERNNTIIKLKDHTAGFGNHWSPRPFLRAGASTTDGIGRPGEAIGYGNHLENLTVDTGDNPGATGIDYTGSTVASIRRLTVTGKGPVGLSITQGLPGPALISRVTVKGFDYGIRIAQGQYGLTLEHLHLSEQKIAGLDNAGNILAIRDLTSVNAVPAIRNGDRGGFISLVDAKLTGGTVDFSAIQSNGELMTRRVSTAGYRSAITQSGRIIAGTELAQYVSKSAFTPFPETQSPAVDLPVRETPDYFPTQAADWASVAAYGAKPDDGEDDTAAFQKALDAGKPVVYLPTGRYVISKPVRITGAVRQIVGFASTLTPTGAAWGNAAAPAALIEVGDGTARDVTITGLRIARAEKSSPPVTGLVAFAQRTTRPLILKDIDCADATTSYQAAPGVGPLYLENVSASGWQFDQPQQVWARQFNHVDRDTATENRSPLLVNAGATVWVLGLETERSGPLLRTERGARTEVLGGAVYEAPSGNAVAFECLDDASMALSFATMGPGYGVYDVLIRQRRGGTSKDLARQDTYWRGEGRTVPLYTG
ncbi:glycoside hydrolase family 55 protein [Planosporangium flavigriseum]|uniref:glycoside hydrolase family 55 protein n=1 Tax=Planosporangium flavigriseum TaxID=373681 RepID=UPI001951B70A|nr:glycoside hydrolase family 55 protein [Planosporangium flavigriseum]